MKNLFIILSVIILFSYSCKTHNKTQQTNQTTTNTSVDIGKNMGTVSHQYQSTGCNTVIIVKTEGGTTPLILIPKDALSADFDKDGLQIYFDYRPLKMPQPKGCAQGIPAEISNISKK